MKPIFIALSPNVQRDDIWLTLKLLFQPWKWKEGNSEEALMKKLRNYLNVDYSFSFNSGRSAFSVILKSLDLEQGQEVLLQSFTCNAAVNPIQGAGLKPVYVDVDPDTLNLDPQDLKKRIGEKSKVVVVQHTFGLPAEIKEIREICERHNLILIEDCAHSLGAKIEGQKVGTFGKAAFFSFGREKVISSVYGGAAVTDDPVLAERIKGYHEDLPEPGYFWVFQQLMHPLLTTLVKAPYSLFELGRFILVAFQKMKLLSKAVTEREKQGNLPELFPSKMPNAMAELSLNQFEKLEKFNTHRQAIADFYDKNLDREKFKLPRSNQGRIYMRYSVLTSEDADQILNKARKKKIFLDDGWRKSPVVPPDTNLEEMDYVWGCCPRAEQVADQIVNLPTHPNISLSKAQRIVKFLNHES